MKTMIIIASLVGLSVALLGCVGTHDLSRVANDNTHVFKAHSDQDLPHTFQRVIAQGRDCLGDGNVNGSYIPGVETQHITVSANPNQPNTSYIVSTDLTDANPGTDVTIHYYGRMYRQKGRYMQHIVNQTPFNCTWY